MKGDTIQCLNPDCRKSFKDINDMVLVKKLKIMCPFCHGTNTIKVEHQINVNPVKIQESKKIDSQSKLLNVVRQQDFIS